MATYYDDIDRNPANKWKVWGKEGSPPDPDVDTPDVEQDFLSTDLTGPQTLRAVLGPYTSESTVYVVVAVERTEDSERGETDPDSVTLPAVYTLDPEDAGAL